MESGAGFVEKLRKKDWEAISKEYMDAADIAVFILVLVVEDVRPH